MSKLMNRLEKLDYFTTKQREFKTRLSALQIEMQATDKEFDDFLKAELQIEGQVHLSDVLKKVLETSYEPIIQTP